LADNLTIHQQINSLLSQRTKVLSVHNDILKDQLALASTLRDSLEGAEPEKLVDRFTEVREALDEVADSSRRTGQSMDSDFRRGAEGVVEAKKESQGFLHTLKEIAKKPFVIAGAFLAGIGDVAVKAVKLLWNTGKITLSTFVQIAESAWNIGSAIVSFPMRVFEGLLAMSDALAQAFLHIARQWEAVRKEFGDPTEDVNRSIHGLVRNMRSFSGEVSSVTRLGLYSVFNDQADAAAYAAEVFGALGSTASILGKQIEELGMDFVVFQKGMGLSGEEMRALGERAITSGRPIQEVLHEVANMSLQLSEAFGFSGKLVSKDMGKMVKDVGRFGNLSVRSLGEVAIRARSLGLEVESLGKVVDKFLTFDDAAESAAKLAQAFGINVDSMTLMREASNGGMGAIDELRRAFFEAGRDAEKMSLVQLRLLAQNTGLSEEEARLAFSMKNRGRSMEDISKQSGIAEKKELSQAEAMSKLADATERYIRFIEMSGGLFDRFAQGFARGIKHNNKFLETMFSLRAVSEEVQWAGFELGKVFVDAFPGVTKMLGALQELYSPAKYKKLMTKVKGAFTEFFEDLSDPKKMAEATRNLMSGLKSALFESWTGPGSIKLLDGVKDFLSGIGHAIAGFIPVMAEQFANGLGRLGDVIEGKGSTGLDSSLQVGMDKMGDGAFDAIMGLVTPITDALSRLWKDGTIQEALVKFLSRVTNQMNEWARNPGDDRGVGEALGEFMFAALNLAWELGVKPALPGLKAKLSEGMSMVWDAAKEAVLFKLSEMWEDVINYSSEKLQFVSDYLQTLAADVGDVAVAISSPFQDAWNTIEEIFDFKVAMNLMEEFTKGMAKGLGDAEESPAFMTLVGSMQAILEFLDINSPSRFAEKMIGENLGKGLTHGVESSLGGFSDTMLDNMNLPATNDAIALMKSNLQADIKAINRSLESIPDIDLSAKISPMGNGMGINGDTLTVEAGRLNLNLHLTVTMEADQVATVLVDKASMVRKERI